MEATQHGLKRQQLALRQARERLLACTCSALSLLSFSLPLQAHHEGCWHLWRSSFDNLFLLLAACHGPAALPSFTIAGITLLRCLEEWLRVMVLAVALRRHDVMFSK